MKEKIFENLSDGAVKLGHYVVPRFVKLKQFKWGKKDA